MRPQRVERAHEQGLGSDAEELVYIVVEAQAGIAVAKAADDGTVAAGLDMAIVGEAVELGAEADGQKADGLAVMEEVGGGWSIRSFRYWRCCVRTEAVSGRSSFGNSSRD